VTAGRMDLFETPEGIRVLDDAYNANPTSMAAALRSARWMAGAGRCIAVLGTMAELGPISAEEHERVGELVARLGIDDLVAVGPEARLTALGAEREGVEPERIFLCDDVEQAVEAVRRLAGPGDLVLVKASRAARLERVAEALRSSSGSVRPSAAQVEGKTA
jgi:UDP-N-acetylmuramoyl-tripeptide--D-alanyl-D-alanine ligase